MRLIDLRSSKDLSQDAALPDSIRRSEVTQCPRRRSGSMTAPSMSG